MINEKLARAAVNLRGLDALGLASAQLATRWATAACSFDAAALRLTTSGTWRVMAGATLHWHRAGAPELTAVDGQAITGSVAVLRLHPQTHLRLARLYALRFDGRSTGASTRPVPLSVAFHAPELPDDVDDATATDPPPAPYDGHLGQDLEGPDWRLGGSLSFHDERGLILDPVAVACAWRDLLLAWPDLRYHSEAAGDLQATGAAGGLGAIAQLGSAGRSVHLVDLHGGPYTPAADAGIGFGATGPAPAPIGTASVEPWPDGQAIRSTGTGATALRWCLATHGELLADPLAIPAFPATVAPVGAAAPSLRRDFFRVAVVHLERHLVGHRAGAAAIEGVPAADAATRADEAPAVRDTETVELLIDGQAALGAMQTARTGRTGVVVAAPVIETDVDLPPDATTRWPQHPPTSATPEPWNPANAGRIRTDWQARFIGTGNDVDLTLPAGIAPREAHVRVFPRVFVEGAALDEGPTALRGDGAAAIVGAGDLRVTLRDPLRLGAQPRPAGAQLRFDVAVVPRPPGVPARARLFGGLAVPIGTGGAAVTPPAPTRSLADVAADRRGEARAPLLGLPRAPQAGDTLDRVLQALAEAAPREAPRFPTMARNDAALAARTASGTTVWDGVLTSGWIAARSLQGDARLGNPGNPGGPEEQVVGVRAVGGRLAYDLGRAVLRRTRHLGPRLFDLATAALDLPAAPAASTGKHAAALLQTVAPVCECPELVVLDPIPVVDQWNEMRTALLAQVSSLTSKVPGLGAITGTEPNRRVTDEIRREARAARHGRRDAQWALRWHVAHARRLVYLESMLLGPTARTPGSDHTWNLVTALVQRLADAPDLRVVIATPRSIPFSPGYASWASYFHEARNSAVDALLEAAPGRVLALHPVGFPGRPATVRGSAVIVDDVWALIGSSTLSRRGLTFDGGLDLSLLDRRLAGGASIQIRDLRRRLMARALGKAPPAAGATPDAGWVRLHQMRSAFDLVAETLALGGEGVVQPYWRGPADGLAQSVALADPEGRDFDSALTAGAFVAALTSLGLAGV